MRLSTVKGHKKMTTDTLPTAWAQEVAAPNPDQALPGDPRPAVLSPDQAFGQLGQITRQLHQAMTELGGGVFAGMDRRGH